MAFPLLAEFVLGVWATKSNLLGCGPSFGSRPPSDHLVLN